MSNRALRLAKVTNAVLKLEQFRSVMIHNIGTLNGSAFEGANATLSDSEGNEHVLPFGDSVTIGVPGIETWDEINIDATGTNVQLTIYR